MGDLEEQGGTALSQEQRRQLAVDLFNRVWMLIELSDRTPEQVDEMIHAAHASRHHWSQVGTSANLARGEWQISRVYTVLGRSEPALYHAHRCLAYVETGGGTGDGIEAWDLPFAYEALARAQGIAGDLGESLRYETLAREAGEGIADDEDRDHLLSELGTLPGRHSSNGR
jgi:hypothetical protein